jgi:hypothetical protein
MTDNVVEMFIPMVVSVSMFSLIGWIVFVIQDGRRRREQLKVMTEFHTKALDKMGSTADFGNFLETEGGKRFLKSLTIEGPGPKQHIVRCTERGILCLVIGSVVMILGWSFPDLRDGFTIIGAIIAACGLGNLISCAASYGLSRSFGLLSGNDDRRSS